MDWLAENWFFVLLLIAFIAMHLFGHGHGGHGHGRHGRDRPVPPPDAPPRSSREPSQHRY